MFVLAAPAYSSEVAEARYRGALGSLMQVNLCTILCSTVLYITIQYSSLMQVMVCLGMLFVNINCDTDWRGGG